MTIKPVESEVTMIHNSETGELVCCAPAGVEVLRTVETDTRKAHAIFNAIQKAYSRGKHYGRLDMKEAVELYMDELSAI